MSKKKEELNTLKDEADALNKKLAELNEEELAQVFGGHVVVDGKSFETTIAATSCHL